MKQATYTQQDKVTIVIPQITSLTKNGDYGIRVSTTGGPLDFIFEFKEVREKLYIDLVRKIEEYYNQ